MKSGFNGKNGGNRYAEYTERFDECYVWNWI